jgi:hypothetical protein
MATTSEVLSLRWSNPYEESRLGGRHGGRSRMKRGPVIAERISSTAQPAQSQLLSMAALSETG